MKEKNSEFKLLSGLFFKLLPYQVLLLIITSINGIVDSLYAGNIVHHGFSSDKKKHSIDIRVVHKNDDIIMRIRDDCAEFDPSEYHKVMQSVDEGQNIGISLVYSIASDVSYQNLLGMNVLTIRL